MGREAKQLFPVKVEEMLDRPTSRGEESIKHYPNKRWSKLVSLSWINGRWSILNFQRPKHDNFKLNGS
jgi:hypothetical protein